MRRKITIALLLCFVCIFPFTACNSHSDDPGGSSDSDSVNLIFNSDTDVVIVSDGGVSAEHLRSIEEVLASRVKSVSVRDSSQPAAEHEIILGASTRDLSKRAYRALNNYDGLDGEVGYCIYSDGSSLAIAFDEEIYGYSVAEDIAVSAFTENYASQQSLSLSAGAVKIERIDPIKYVEELDAIKREEEWAEIEEYLAKTYDDKIAASATDALKSLMTLYSDDMVTWLASLYDPAIGGFYYSNSARNSLGYLPDLESTYQALGFITSSGMGEVADIIPENVANQIVEFTRSLQDSESGYFYHPQWGKELTDKHTGRLGRDINNAVNILKYFGYRPKYDTPTGVEGDERRGAAPAAALTTGLSYSKTAAVSSVILASDSDAGVKEYLLNEENFRKWLKGYEPDMVDNSYWVGNELESTAPQIVARDAVLKERGEKYSLCSILEKWLNDHQDPETGLWEPYVPGRVHECINSVLKISSAYNKIGKKIPNALKAMEYAIDAITTEQEPGFVCDAFNTWYAVSTLTRNIETFGGAEGAAAARALKDTYINEYAHMVSVTKEKLSLFLKTYGTSLGSFSYFPDKTSETSQGLPVALSNVNEGDVNSTYICSAAIGWGIYGFIGLSPVDIMTDSDGMRFRKQLESCGAVIKDTEIEPIPIDFEGINSVDELFKVYGFDKWLPLGELAIDESKPYGVDSKVLRLTTLVGGYDLFQVNITKPQGAFNTVAFESDIMFMPEISSKYEMLLMGNSSSVKAANLFLRAVPGDGVYLESAEFDGIKIASPESWFNLRVEYSYIGADEILCEIFINYNLKATIKLPYSGAAIPTSSVKRIQFAADTNQSSGSVYFDNLFLEQCTKALPEGSDSGNSGPSEEETGYMTFEKKPLGVYQNQNWLDYWIPAGSLEIVDAKPYGKDSKALALTTEGKSGDLVQVKLTKSETSFNAVGFETDIMFDTTAPSEFLMLLFGSSSSIRGYEITVTTDGNGVYISSADFGKIKIAEQKEWFKLGFGYAKISATNVYVAVLVDGEVVAEGTTPYNPNRIPQTSEITRMQFSASHKATSDGTVYFDNTILAQLTYDIPDEPTVNPDPDPEPEPEPDPTPNPEQGSPYEDGDNVADGDWTVPGRFPDVPTAPDPAPDPEPDETPDLPYDDGDNVADGGWT